MAGTIGAPLSLHRAKPVTVGLELRHHDPMPHPHHDKIISATGTSRMTTATMATPHRPLPPCCARCIPDRHADGADHNQLSAVTSTFSAPPGGRSSASSAAP